jgi:hypothetical protein
MSDQKSQKSGTAAAPSATGTGTRTSWLDAEPDFLLEDAEVTGSVSYSSAPSVLPGPGIDFDALVAKFFEDAKEEQAESASAEPKKGREKPLKSNKGQMYDQEAKRYFETLDSDLRSGKFELKTMMVELKPLVAPSLVLKTLTSSIKQINFNTWQKLLIMHALSVQMYQMHQLGHVHGAICPLRVATSNTPVGGADIFLLDSSTGPVAGPGRPDSVCIPPEFEGKADVKATKAGDVFSMGALFSCIWLNYPDDRPGGSYARLQVSLSMPNSSIPESIRRVLCSMTMLDPNSRPSARSVLFYVDHFKSRVRETMDMRWFEQNRTTGSSLYHSTNGSEGFAMMDAESEKS